MGIDDLDKAELARLYGPWKSHTPADVAALLDGYAGLWWMSGGWAIEAFTGIHRDHDDTDLSILRADLGQLCSYLSERDMDVWAASDGALLPLFPGANVGLPIGTNQVWTRRGATEPWEFDILLAPGTPTTWVYRRDRHLTMPMDEALWTQDGVRYLRPEIQLLYKAAGHRPKDEADFQATAPLLDPARRVWLRGALSRTLPGHPWVDALR